MNRVKTAVLLGLLSSLFLGVGYLIGGGNGLLIGLVVALAINVFSYFNSDKLALRAARAAPLEGRDRARVEGIVSRLAARTGMPMPSLWRIRAPQPNAFATGRNPEHAAVAVTDGILELMDDDELEGVLAHELAHVGNRDILISSIAGTIATAIAMFSFIARFGALFGGRDDDGGANPLALLAVAIVGPLAASIVQMTISRSREYHADETGARTTGDPLALARALRKLEQASMRTVLPVPPTQAHMFISDPYLGLRRQEQRREAVAGVNRMPLLVRLFSTHPPIGERVARLEAMAGVPH